MRLTVQSFENLIQTLKSYKNERLLGDIDSTNRHYECRRICFSNASMPANKTKETLNVVEVVELQ
jgi:hypothetical protein